LLWLATLSGLATLVGLAPQLAYADGLPLWEFGMGVGAVVFNDYRGSSAVHGYPVPLPYFVYRGRILRSDRDGLHGRFLSRRYVEFDISLNATAPVFSSSSGARSGMPTIDPTLEMGPSLQWHLWRSAQDSWRLDLRTPLREALTLSSSPRAIGLVFAPNFNLDYRIGGSLTGWNLGLLAGPLYAQRRYHEYFYAVAPQYATATRPAYEPAGGYAGTQALASISKRYAGYWVGAYLRHDWLQGAVFEGSPLVQQRSYWAGGIGIVWMIKASAGTVESDE
jgi:outer membrane scaffolding protein for murein synthesis (MipA/OmpV family)